eukprot:1422254-Rhodomonas_salina.1
MLFLTSMMQTADTTPLAQIQDQRWSWRLCALHDTPLIRATRRNCIRTGSGIPNIDSDVYITAGSSSVAADGER